MSATEAPWGHPVLLPAALLGLGCALVLLLVWTLNRRGRPPLSAMGDSLLSVAVGSAYLTVVLWILTQQVDWRWNRWFIDDPAHYVIVGITAWLSVYYTFAFAVARIRRTARAGAGAAR